jgi:hypothetical protein
MLSLIFSVPAFAAEDLCSYPFKAEQVSSNKVACSVEVNLPDFGEPEHYCDYVSDGYMGYVYSTVKGRSHTCPNGFYKGENGEGDEFCTVDDIEFPINTTVTPDCRDMVWDGHISYILKLGPESGETTSIGLKGISLGDQASVACAKARELITGSPIYNLFMYMKWADTDTHCGLKSEILITGLEFDEQQGVTNIILPNTVFGFSSTTPISVVSQAVIDKIEWVNELEYVENENDPFFEYYYHYADFNKGVSISISKDFIQVKKENSDISF